MDTQEISDPLKENAGRDRNFRHLRAFGGVDTSTGRWPPNQIGPISLGPDDIIYIEFRTDSTGSEELAVIRYEARINDEWHTIALYDNCHGKGYHGHRYHPDGTKSPMPAHNVTGIRSVGEFVSKARRTLMSGFWWERKRYEKELQRVGLRKGG